MIALKYEATGQEEVTEKYFLAEHTHTTKAGALLNASAVAKGINSLKTCKLKKYLR
jgi:rhamnogalacturonan acetylesterase